MRKVFLSAVLILIVSPAAAADGKSSAVKTEYKQKYLRENIKAVDEMIEKLNENERDPESTLSGLLSSSEVKTLLSETEIQMDYVDTQMDTKMPRILVGRIRQYPLSLASVGLCGQLNFAAGALAPNKSARELSARLQALASKWCGHAFSLAKVYEFRDFATRFGEKSVQQ